MEYINKQSSRPRKLNPKNEIFNPLTETPRCLPVTSCHGDMGRDRLVWTNDSREGDMSWDNWHR